MNTTNWLPTHRRGELKALAARSHQVVTFAATVGVITGLVVAGFDRLVVDVSMSRVLQLSPWAIEPSSVLLSTRSTSTYGE